MRKVGIFEGKTQFSALIEEARKGATIVVTKNGEPVAQIGPVIADESADKARDAMKRILANKATLGRATIRDLIEEGRRH